MEHIRFNENEIPFQTLEKFGLTHEMIEDLPVRVINDILEGRRSPVLPIKVSDEDGAIVKSRSRFSLVCKEDGQIDVLFYPELQEAELSRFNDQEKIQLEKGKSIISIVEDKNGNQVKSFVQLDKETKQVLSVPTQVIGHNLQILSEEIHLNTAELNRLQNGDPITYALDGNNEAITIGIDLEEKSGLRLIPGDAKMWSEQRTRDWDKYTFGLYGCWIMDEDGNLDYVNEDDYTDEIWNEQKKAGARSLGLTR